MATGTYFSTRSDKIDAPIEQAAENILKNNGIDVDFSADKKKAASAQQAKKTDEQTKK
jgi:hypothetical protein